MTRNETVLMAVLSDFSNSNLMFGIPINTHPNTSIIFMISDDSSGYFSSAFVFSS